MSAWTDSHCHLQDEFFDEGANAPAEVMATLQRAHDAGVDRVVIVGTGAASSYEALELATLESTVELYATVGLHPHDAKDDLAPVAELARAGNDRLVAIGECGLDYYYEHSPRDQQRHAFSAQVALAKELDLALVVHARGAFDDLFAIFRSEGVPPRTVIHCFTGGPDEAQRCLDLGAFLSFSGIVTFKNAEDVRAAAAICPLDRLLVETDAPFLAPAPHRGEQNHPAWVPIVGEAVATVKGITAEELAATSTAAVRAAFAIG